MKLAELDPKTLHELLHGDGLALRVGPFVFRLRTRIPHLIDDLQTLYASHPAGPPEAFSDFHVEVVSPNPLRRAFRPQVRFVYDGDSPFTPLPLSQATAMLEWGMNWCVSAHANHFLVVHAAVLEKRGCALVMPAPPGNGKSTLCAALAMRGWRLFSDELALLSLTERLLYPMPRPVGLKNQSIDVIRAFAHDAVLGKPCYDTHKGTVAHLRPGPDCVARAAEPAAARLIVFPKYVAGAETLLEPYDRASAFIYLAENAFNYHLIGEPAFDALGAAMDDCAGYRLEYSDLDDAISRLQALLPEQAA